MVLLQRRRSDRIIIPRSRPDNAYGDKPSVQIEWEIREKRDTLEKELKQPEKNINKVHTILHSIKTLKEILPHASLIRLLKKVEMNSFITFYQMLYNEKMLDHGIIEMLRNFVIVVLQIGNFGELQWKTNLSLFKTEIFGN